MSSLVDGLIYAQEHGINLHVRNAAAMNLLVPATNLTLIEQIRACEAKGFSHKLGVPLTSNDLVK